VGPERPKFWGLLTNSLHWQWACRLMTWAHTEVAVGIANNLFMFNRRQFCSIIWLVIEQIGKAHYLSSTDTMRRSIKSHVTLMMYMDRASSVGISDVQKPASACFLPDPSRYCCSKRVSSASQVIRSAFSCLAPVVSLLCSSYCYHPYLLARDCYLDSGHLFD
jgi:hypothetical protein